MPDAMDSEMREMEFENITNAAHQQGRESRSPDDVVWEMLTLARQLIDQGKPSPALQAVVMALRTKGGEQAVLQSMNRARELYTKRVRETASVDQLASLFAECAIAEAQPIGTEQSSPNMGGRAVLPDAQGTILAETGRTQVVLDAVSDGSSFICLKCGGLVSKLRKDEHDAYWCGAI